MGDNKRALTLIIEKLEDVEMAVDFVRGIGDEDLWSDLIDQAKTKPGMSTEKSSCNSSVHKRTTRACGEHLGSDTVGKEYSSRYENRRTQGESHQDLLRS
jgi:hypothetical protein